MGGSIDIDATYDSDSDSDSDEMCDVYVVRSLYTANADANAVVYSGFADEGDDDDEELPPDVQLALATRGVYDDDEGDDDDEEFPTDEEIPLTKSSPPTPCCATATISHSRSGR